MSGLVVVLNGVGSVGKSRLARGIRLSARGDRMLCLARAQPVWVDNAQTYDLTPDNASMHTAGAAKTNCERVDL